MIYRIIFSVVVFLLQAQLSAQQGVAINNEGSSLHKSGILDVKRTDKGMRGKRMSTEQRTAIANVVKGLLVFDNNTSSFWFYSGTAWTELSSGGNEWTVADNNLYNRNSGNVGIGTTLPSEKLDVAGNIRSRARVDADGVIEGNGLSSTGALYVQGTSLLTGAVTVSSSASFGGNVNSNTGMSITDPAGILQFKNGSDDKGFLQLSGDNLRIGTNSSNTNGRFVIRTGGADRFHVDGSGNVGIGVAAPLVKLHVASGSIYAEGMIQALDDFNTAGNIYLDGSVRRFGITGSANLVPYAYGVVNSNGTIRTGTGNFTVTLGAQGEYTINCPNVGPNYCVSVSPMNTSNYGNATWRIVDNNSFEVSTGGWDPALKNSISFDCPFSFIVYKK